MNANTAPKSGDDPTSDTRHAAPIHARDRSPADQQADAIHARIVDNSVTADARGDSEEMLSLQATEDRRSIRRGRESAASRDSRSIEMLIRIETDIDEMRRARVGYAPD